MKGTPLYERVYACLAGGAVGDAMGFATEGMHYTAIRRLFGRVDAPMLRRDGDQLHPKVTDIVYTDDTVMKHMVLTAIFESGGHPTIEAIADVWRREVTDHTSWVWWLNTRVVASKLQWNPLLPLRDVGRDSIPCNDAAMIIGPIGLLNAGDPDRAATAAWDLSALWQTGYSRECAAAMAAAHAEALRTGATIETVIETVRRTAPTLRPYLDRALNLVAEVSGPDEFTERFYAEQLHFPNESFWTPPDHPCPDWSFGADPLEVCTEALAFLVLSRGNARDAILASINFGRDCDTIAGISAALCGALNGPASLPADWVATIQQANPTPQFDDLALKLSHLIRHEAQRLSAQAAMILEQCRPEW